MASAQGMPCRRSHRNMPAAGGVQLAKPPRCSYVQTASSFRLHEVGMKIIAPHLSTYQTALGGPLRPDAV